MENIYHLKAVISVLDLIMSADSGILLFVQEYIRNPILDFIMSVFSVIGNGGIVWIAVAILLLLTSKYRRVGFDLLLCIGICYLINDLLLKETIQRSRPFQIIDEIEVMLGSYSASGSWSFPSGHTCSSFAAAYALTRGLGKKGALFYIPAALISVSRIYIGVHYPSDILVGAIIGTLGSMIVYILSKRYIKLGRLAT